MSNVITQFMIDNVAHDIGADAKNIVYENTSVQKQLDEHKGQIINMAGNKANINDVYNKNDTYNKKEIENMIGNGTIIIKQGNEQKGIFTTNQKSSVTINLDAGSGISDTDAVIENSLIVKGYVVEGKERNITTELLKVLLTDFSSKPNGYLSIYSDTDNNAPLDGYVYVFGDTGCPSIDKIYAETAKDLISQIKQYTTNTILDVVCSINNIATPNVIGKMWIGYSTQERLYFSFDNMRLFEGISELELIKFTTVVGDWYELTSPISINNIINKNTFNINTQFYQYIYDINYSYKSKYILTYSELENIKTMIDINRYYKGIIDNQEHIDCLIAFEKNDCGIQNILSIYSTGSIGHTLGGTSIGDVIINNIILTHSDISPQFGHYSHSEGLGTIATGDYQHVQGKYNIINKDYAHIVGGGTSDFNRKNIHTLDWNGNATFAGDIILNSFSSWEEISPIFLDGVTIDNDSLKLSETPLILDGKQYLYKYSFYTGDTDRLLLKENKYYKTNFNGYIDKEIILEIHTHGAENTSITMWSEEDIDYIWGTCYQLKCIAIYNGQKSLLQIIADLQSRIAALEAK